MCAPAHDVAYFPGSETHPCVQVYRTRLTTLVVTIGNADQGVKFYNYEPMVRALEKDGFPINSGWNATLSLSSAMDRNGAWAHMAGRLLSVIKDGKFYYVYVGKGCNPPAFHHGMLEHVESWLSAHDYPVQEGWE